MRRLAGGFVPSICGLQGDDLVGLGHGRRRWVDRAGTRRIRLRHSQSMTSLNVVAAFQVRGLSDQFAGCWGCTTPETSLLKFCYS